VWHKLGSEKSSYEYRTHDNAKINQKEAEKSGSMMVLGIRRKTKQGAVEKTIELGFDEVNFVANGPFYNVVLLEVTGVKEFDTSSAKYMVSFFDRKDATVGREPFNNVNEVHRSKAPLTETEQKTVGRLLAASSDNRSQKKRKREEEREQESAEAEMEEETADDSSGMCLRSSPRSAGKENRAPQNMRGKGNRGTHSAKKRRKGAHKRDFMYLGSDLQQVGTF
jgi:hypothetical protein